jgi:hypothetical protein
VSRAWHHPWYDDLNTIFHEVCKLTTLSFFSSPKPSRTSLISRRYWPEEIGTRVEFPVHPGFEFVEYLPSQCCFVTHYITDLVNQFLRTQRHILKHPCYHITAVKYWIRMRRKWCATSALNGLYTPQTQLCWCTSNRAAKVLFEQRNQPESSEQWTVVSLEISVTDWQTSRYCTFLCTYID